MKLPELTIPGAEMMYDAAQTALDAAWNDYLTKEEKTGETDEPAPGTLYQRAYVDTIRTYAMNTELAQEMLAMLLASLPHSRKTPGKGLDAVMGLVTLLHTREAVHTLFLQDQAENTMLQEVRKQPKRPTFDEGGKTRRDLDRKIAESANQDQRISDEKIGDIAFGGNKEKIDRRVRDSAHDDPDRERTTVDNVEQREDGVYAGPIALPKMKKLHMLSARACFKETTAWTAGASTALATGEIQPEHLPRLRSLFGRGIDLDGVHEIIRRIFSETRQLKAPEEDKPDEVH